MSIKRKIAFILAALFILLVFLEGVSRLVLSIDPAFNKIAGTDNSSWRLRWIKRHQDEIEIYYKFDIYDPSKGWMSKSNLKNESVFDGKILNTNSRGIRSNVEYSYDRDPDRIRILVVGDSFTFGDEVGDAETYSYYLQTMIPGSEVINMGVHGYGHDQMLIRLKEEGIKYKPDIVILGFVYEDMYRNILSFRDFAKPRFEIVNGKIAVTNTPVPSPDEILRWEWARPAVYDLYTIIYNRLLHNRFMSRYGLFEKKTKELTKCILDEMVGLIDSMGAMPVFVYLPVGNEIVSSDDITRGEAFFYEYCGGNDKVRCLSSKPYFIKKENQGVEFKLTGHWRSSGHKAVAEAIYEYLINHEIL